ncbi:MAG: hypothetical protein CMB64_02250 [Euryarchaeota archaeon]|nr:hypothetical protein [Euryarchaeota archaeon]|tara:strand:+ start:1916 stop:3184 length:1269 start_codon:yes stop_codon:yes gene_type:complete
MPWIGLDDTDTLSGGCTTYEFHLLFQHLNQLSNEGFPWNVCDPRLVRLWPFASNRTRGNAALALKIEIIEKDEELLFKILEKWYRDLNIKISTLEIIQSKHSERLQFPPEPCLLYLRKQNPDFYWSAVRHEVSLNSAFSLVSEQKGSKYWASKEKMNGLIGALAAISWNGNNDFTWELTAYRDEHMYSKIRMIQKESVSEISRLFPNTILNRDPNSKKTLIAPSTPCPVLYGIRAESSKEAILAHEYLQSIVENEKAKSFQVWRSNQATGDHIKNSKSGIIASSPKTIRGGHTSIKVTLNGEEYRELELLAFEESGKINKLAQKLKKGDYVEWEGLESPSNNIHLEKIRLIRSSIRDKKRPNCDCGGKLKSSGKNKPLRCEICGNYFPRLWQGVCLEPSEWIEPEASQRRHLAKPLGRQNFS